MLPRLRESVRALPGRGLEIRRTHGGRSGDSADAGLRRIAETILETVVDAAGDHADAVRAQAAGRDRVLERLIREASLTRLDQALVELRRDFLPLPATDRDPDQRAGGSTP